MQSKKTSVERVEGQANELDRGTRDAHEDASDRHEDVILDDEYERPPHDRSPLT